MPAVAITEASGLSRRSRSTRPSAPRARFALYVAALVLVVGAVCAVCVPVGAGLDEPMHVARVEQIAEGQLLPLAVDTDDIDTTLVGAASEDYVAYGGETDAALYALLAQGNTVYFDLYETSESMGFTFPSWEDVRLSTDGEMGEGTVTWIFSNTAVNSPVSYAPYVLAFLVAMCVTSSPVAVVLAMRLAGVLTMAVAVWACLRLLPVGQQLFAVVALLPTGLMVNSMVTADLMTYVCASLYVCCLLRMLLLERAGGREWAVLWASLFCLCLCKTTYAALGLLLLALPVMSRAWRTPRNLVRIGVVGFTSLGAFLAWYLSVSDINTGLMWSSDVDPEAQVAYVLTRPLEFLGAVFRGILKTDAFLLRTQTNYASFASATWPTVMLLLVAFSNESRRLAGEGRMGLRRSLVVALSLLLAVGVVVLLIYLALYLQFTAVGDSSVSGVQTRYFYPLIFPVLFALMVLAACFSAGRGSAGAGAAAPGAEAGAVPGAGSAAVLEGQDPAAVAPEAERKVLRFPLSVRELPASSYVLVSVLLTALCALCVYSLVWTIYY